MFELSFFAFDRQRSQISQLSLNQCHFHGEVVLYVAPHTQLDARAVLFLVCLVLLVRRKRNLIYVWVCLQYAVAAGQV